MRTTGDVVMNEHLSYFSCVDCGGMIPIPFNVPVCQCRRCNLLYMLQHNTRNSTPVAVPCNNVDGKLIPRGAK